MNMPWRPALGLMTLFLLLPILVKSYSNEINLLFDTHRGEGIRSHIRCWTGAGRGEANRSITAPRQHEVQKHSKYQETEQTYEQREVEKMTLTPSSLKVGVSEWERSDRFAINPDKDDRVRGEAEAQEIIRFSETKNTDHALLW